MMRHCGPWLRQLHRLWYGLVCASLLLGCQIPEPASIGTGIWSLVGTAVYPDLPEATAWSLDKPMNYDGAKYWRLLIKLDGGKFMKFRKGGRWAKEGGDELGGNLRSLTQSGGNIRIPATGYYQVELDPVAKMATLRFQE